MASKLSVRSLLLFRRSYAVATETVRGLQPAAASVVRKVTDLKSSSQGQGPVAVQKEEFWMKDPKTGNWIPEKHFNEVDAADLREKLLSKKH